MSGRHQLMFRDSKARGLCAFNLADVFRLSAAQMMASSCCSPQLRRDLAFKQGQAFLPGGVILLTKCEPTDIASAFAARRHDHMIGRQCLRSQGQLPTALTGAAHGMLRQMCGGVKYTCWTEPAKSASHSAVPEILARRCLYLPPPEVTGLLNFFHPPITFVVRERERWRDPRVRLR